MSEKDCSPASLRMAQSSKGSKTNHEVDTLETRRSLFTTCYCVNYNEPALIESLVKILNHNGVATDFLQREHCCGCQNLSWEISSQ